MSSPPPTKKQKIESSSSSEEEHKFLHICTREGAPLFKEKPPTISIQDIPIETTLKKNAPICVLEDDVEYRRVLVKINEQDDECITGYMKAHHSGKNDQLHYNNNNNNTTKQFTTIMDQANYNEKTSTFTFSMDSIGIFHSCFPEKNGTPRQGNLCPLSRGKVTVTIPQGHHAIEELDQFQFVWLIFVFHQNTPCSAERTKIRPPRMDGNARVGMYATRTPHRPNAIGLTMATIDKIVNNELFVSGVDLVDGTPILDIKPVIPRYDCVPAVNARVPEWIGDDKYVPKIAREQIVWSDDSVKQLQAIVQSGKMKYYSTYEEISEAIIQVLQTDPRPVYVRKKSTQKLYGFRIDVANVRCSVHEKDRIEIVEIELWE
jgi:tRNA-Thr(GGU) m(6)t(6)A37 methyltransferase TsaA